MCFYFQRMSASNSQVGQNPAESSILNNEHQSDIDRSLSREIVTTTRAITTDQSAPIQFNPTDMIVNVQQEEQQQQHNRSPRQNAPGQEHNYQQTQQQQNRQEQHLRLQQQARNLQNQLRQIQQQRESLRQEAQRERRRRQRQRQRERFQQWLQSQNLTYEQWQERQNREHLEQQQRQTEQQNRQERQGRTQTQYIQQRPPGFDADMDEILQERLLEQYQLEQMTPQERQVISEQNHLNELQEGPPPRLTAMPMQDLEQYMMNQQDQIWTDEFEQTINIDELETSDRLMHHYRNEEQLIQKEQWEEIPFLYQQLHEPIQ